MSISTIPLRVIRFRWWLLTGKFLGRPGPDRRLLLEAFSLLALARFAILVIPFRRLAAFLGQVMGESPFRAPETEVLAKRISWAVQTTARHTPWESKCLAQAMAAKMMLKRRKVPSTLYLGLAKNVKAGLYAHAWLRCGERVLTGGPDNGEFTVVAQFAEEGF